MKDLIHEATGNTPEVFFSLQKNKFMISGISAPEDVRALFDPLIEWMTSFLEEIKTKNPFNIDNPLTFKFNLSYFNSSSAKFLFDILLILKELKAKDIPLIIEWHYDFEDTDLMDAGDDLAMISGLEFKFCPENKNDL